MKQNKNIVGLESCTRVQVVGFWLLSTEPEIQVFMWDLWYGTWNTGAEKRLNICTDFLQQAEADENTKKLIIMGDELWVYDTMSKQSTSSLHSRSQNLPQDWQKHSRGDWMWGPCLLFQLLKSECPIYSLVEVQQWTSLSMWHHLQEPV